MSEDRIPYPTDKPFDEAMDALERALVECPDCFYWGEPGSVCSICDQVRPMR